MSRGAELLGWHFQHVGEAGDARGGDCERAVGRSSLQPALVDQRHERRGAELARAGNYLAAQYQRLKPRRRHKRALGAIKHSIICAIGRMLCTGETYRDLGGDYFTN